MNQERNKGLLDRFNEKRLREDVPTERLTARSTGHFLEENKKWFAGLLRLGYRGLIGS